MRGQELLARYDDLPDDIEWLPLVHARALPGGAVERDFYESVKAEILDRLVSYCRSTASSSTFTER